MSEVLWDFVLNLQRLWEGVICELNARHGLAGKGIAKAQTVHTLFVRSHAVAESIYDSDVLGLVITNLLKLLEKTEREKDKAFVHPCPSPHPSFAWQQGLLIVSVPFLSEWLRATLATEADHTANIIIDIRFNS